MATSESAARSKRRRWARSIGRSVAGRAVSLWTRRRPGDLRRYAGKNRPRTLYGTSTAWLCFIGNGSGPSRRELVVHPVSQVMTAALPSSFQVPFIPSPRVALATPPLDNVISKGCPPVSATFHTPSNAPAARLPPLITPIKQVAVAIAISVFLLLLS